MTPIAEPARSPVVSVVIPAYNAAWCVRKAIDSVLAQTFRSFELIVVDDGSTDSTPNVLASYGNAISVVRQPNRGMGRARNAGIQAATGEFIAFLDSDDWWLPQKLERQVALMRSAPHVGFSSCAARVEDPEGRLLNLWRCPGWEGDFLVHLFSSGADVPGSCSAVMARRQLVVEAGGFDESLRGVEDPDLWMRLAAVTDYACLDEAMAVVLRRPGSVSRNREAMRGAAIRVLRKNRHLLPVSHRGAYWRQCLANVHADYSKWRYRDGNRVKGVADALRALILSPIGRGRLALGLLKDMVLSREL